MCLWLLCSGVMYFFVQLYIGVVAVVSCTIIGVIHSFDWKSAVEHDGGGV